MEKRLLVALALSLLVMLVYPHLLQKIYGPPGPLPSPQPVALESAVPQAEIETPTPVSSPVLPEEKFDYEDSAYRAVFSSQGGGVAALSLKAFENGKNHANALVKELPNLPRGFSVRVLEAGVWREPVYALAKKEAQSVTLEHEEPNAYRLRKTFWFLPDRFSIVIELSLENLSSQARRFEYEIVVPLAAGETRPSDQASLEADYLKDGQVEARPAGKLAKGGYLKEGPLEWVALENKYFAMIVKPEGRLEHVRSVFEEGTLLHFVKPEAVELASGASLTQRFLVYAGPKSYATLKDSRMGFERILHTKVLGGLWIYFLILLKFFYKVFHNYGVAIVILSSLIKIVFAPLTHMSFESMRKMQTLQPKIKALQEQHKKDPQKLNREVMELYKRHKVNPFGGCLPMVLQMPIFIALYQTFSTAIELRGAPFVWWVTDLSEPDQLFLLPFSIPLLGNQVNILPLIMIGTMLWQQKLTPQTAATKEQEMMMLLMPVIFGFAFYGLPSGLVIYWVVNNLLTILHQLFIKKTHIAPA